MKISRELDYSAYLYTCNKCRSCIHPAENPSEIICPSFYEKRFITFSGAGRLYTAQGILENVVSISSATTCTITYECMLCYACAKNCPASLPLPETLYDLRETVFSENPPFHALKLKEKIERFGNPWGKLHTFGGKGEITLFTGCTYSFMYPETVNRFVNHLRKEGKNVKVISEKCCGAPLYEIGEKEGFMKMASMVMKEAEGCETLYVMDPHCLWALKSFCEEEGIYIELLPAFTLVEHPSSYKRDGELLFHDSCKLGRFCGYYYEPRALLQKIGVKLKEFTLNKKSSLCCGGNWGSEPSFKRAVKKRKVKEVKRYNLPLVVSCPLCRYTLRSVTVIDIHELISEE